MHLPEHFGIMLMLAARFNTVLFYFHNFFIHVWLLFLTFQTAAEATGVRLAATVIRLTRVGAILESEKLFLFFI